jgi:hypothetical protein
MVEVAQSSEMVRNFNNFKAFVTFAMKNWKFCSTWSKNFEFGYFCSWKNVLDNAYVCPENFF